MAEKIKGLTVVIPTRNEAEGIAGLVRAVSRHTDEVIVIDGNSTDGTADRAREAGALVWPDHGRGKGDAYKVGIEKATGEAIVFIDADGSHEVDDIPLLARPILDNQADLVIASRYRGGSDEWEGDLDTWLRSIGSCFLSVVINYRWRGRMTDVLNGFRAVRTDTARKIKLHADDFDIEQHMVVQFLRFGHRVTEVRSHEYCRAWGKSKLPTFRKAYLFFWRLFLDLI